MTLGVRLRGEAADLAALQTLARALPELVSARWVEVSAGDQRILASPEIAEDAAETLRQSGLDVIRLTRRENDLVLRDFGEDDAAPSPLPGAHTRNAQHLLEALRPLPVDRPRPPAEALFVMSAHGDAPRHVLERVLLLGRDDVTVAEWLARDERLFVVRADRPPHYLLMRAHEEPDEGVRAYARAAPGLWVEWGFAHPLAAIAGEVVRERGRDALVDRDGRWREIDERWPSRSVYDALKPELPAARVRLTPAPDETRFSVRLRLAPGPPSEPELWLLSPEQLLRLESLVDSAPRDDLGSLTLARLLHPDDGPVYLLRERPRAGRRRLGLRISELCEAEGFSHTDGADNLYLPVGSRLLPAMRRDELKELLGLDTARAAVLRDRGDGPEVITVPAVDEEPLDRFVDYIATDRRVELDRLLEDAVFHFPGVVVNRPKKVDAVRPQRDAPEKKPRRSFADLFKRGREVDANELEDEQTTETEVLPSLDEQAALRAEARALEQRAAEGGVTVEKAWYELAVLKELLEEVDDACASLEAALLFAEEGRDVERARTLASWRARLAPHRGADDDILQLALEEDLTPTDATLLGARALVALLGGEPLPDGVLPVLVRTFSRPALPVSRRLAWLVLWACHQTTSDKLGLTRAKEALIGQLNDRGLNETWDLPRFIRYALALDDDSDASGERNRLEQLDALDRLWELASSDLRELEPLSAYKRLLFAVGYARAGATGQARELARPVEDELPAHDRPNRELFRLYLARLAHAQSDDDDDAFHADVEQILVSIGDDRARRAVDWLRKRSPWLRAAEHEPPAPWLRPQLQRALEAAERDPKKASATVRRALEEREHFDYEVAQAVVRGVRAVMRTGNDALIDDVVDAAAGGLRRIGVLGHRALAIGCCIEAAAATGDLGTVHRLLDGIIEIARAPRTPSVRDLLRAVRPALLALRRLGAAGSADHFLHALVPLTESHQKDRAPLAAALADGFLQLGDRGAAADLIDRASEASRDAQLEYGARYDGAAAVLDTLRHWPTAERAERGAELLRDLDAFNDTFTVRVWFPTHKLLVIERLVDTVVDVITFSSDRVRAYLDADELALRRRIAHDWSEL